jgi:hypothetical protein
MAIVVLALLDPSLRLEERERLPTVVALVTDESASQTIEDRDAMARAAAESLRPSLKRSPMWNCALSRLETDPDTGTPAIGPIQAELADVPLEQLGAVILLTDGQIADAPQDGPGLCRGRRRAGAHAAHRPS